MQLRSNGNKRCRVVNVVFEVLFFSFLFFCIEATTSALFCSAWATLHAELGSYLGFFLWLFWMFDEISPAAYGFLSSWIFLFSVLRLGSFTTLNSFVVLIPLCSGFYLSVMSWSEVVDVTLVCSAVFIASLENQNDPIVLCHWFSVSMVTM